MKYIALLRGINISGKNKISMSSLKEEIKRLGYENVSTYLNSGNVIFTTDLNHKSEISQKIQVMIQAKFGLEIPVYVMEASELKELLAHRPNWWGQDQKEIYDNIIFVIPPYTYKQIYQVLGEPKEELEQIQEYKNNIFWSYNLKEYRKTNWWSKTASTNVKDVITIRTAHTMKKLLEMCEQ